MAGEFLQGLLSGRDAFNQRLNQAMQLRQYQQAIAQQQFENAIRQQQMDMLGQQLQWDMGAPARAQAQAQLEHDLALKRMQEQERLYRSRPISPLELYDRFGAANYNKVLPMAGMTEEQAAQWLNEPVGQLKPSGMPPLPISPFGMFSAPPQVQTVPRGQTLNFRDPMQENRDYKLIIANRDSLVKQIIAARQAGGDTTQLRMQLWMIEQQLNPMLAGQPMPPDYMLFPEIKPIDQERLAQSRQRIDQGQQRIDLSKDRLALDQQKFDWKKEYDKATLGIRQAQQALSQARAERIMAEGVMQNAAKQGLGITPGQVQTLDDKYRKEAIGVRRSISAVRVGLEAAKKKGKIDKVDFSTWSDDARKQYIQEKEAELRSLGSQLEDLARKRKQLAPYTVTKPANTPVSTPTPSTRLSGKQLAPYTVTKPANTPVSTPTPSTRLSGSQQKMLSTAIRTDAQKGLSGAELGPQVRALLKNWGYSDKDAQAIWVDYAKKYYWPNRKKK